MEKKMLELDLPKLFWMLQKLVNKFDEATEFLTKTNEAQPPKMSHPIYGKILFIEDVADILGYTPNTIYRLIKDGKLHSLKPGNRHLFYEKHIIDFLDKNR